MRRIYRNKRVMSHSKAFSELRRRVQFLCDSGVVALEMAAFDAAETVSRHRPLELLTVTELEEPEESEALALVKAVLEGELRVPVCIWSRFDLPSCRRAALLASTREVI